MSPPSDDRLRISVLGPVRAWIGERELNLGPGRQPLEPVAHQVPQPPSYRVAHDRATNAAAYHKAHASRRVWTVRAGNQVDDHKRAADPHTAPYGAAVITGTTQTVLGRQHANSSHRERHRPAGFRPTGGHGPCDVGRR